MNSNIETMMDIQKGLDAICLNRQYEIETPYDYVKDLYATFNEAAFCELKVGFANFYPDEEVIEMIRIAYLNNDAAHMLSPIVLYSSLLDLISKLSENKVDNALPELSDILTTIAYGM